MSMSSKRIHAVLIQEYYLTIRSIENILDIFYSSAVTIVVFGFFTLYIAKVNNNHAVNFLILGMMLWEIVRVVQFSICMGSLNNLWSRNLSNMFITPLTIQEYIIANMISSVIKATIVFALVSLIGIFYFKFNIFQIGIINLLFYFLNLTIFAWSVGIFILGLIFAYGTRIQAFAWSLIYLFQPVCAVFYPKNILPHFLQLIASAVPITYVFEDARSALVTHGINWQSHGTVLFINIIYFILASIFFKWMFNSSRKSGQFARSEG